MGAAHHLAAGRCGRCGGTAAGRVQHRSGHGRDHRRKAGVRPPPRAHFLYRLGPHGQAGGNGGGGQSDADLDAAAATGALMYRNAGQVCLAGTRFLVHESIRDAFVEKMRAVVANLVVGDPRDPATEVGPIIHPRQVERVAGFVERAKAAGATTLWGGERHTFGPQYFQPTMFCDVTNDAEIVQQEVFGPVLVMQTFASDEEAIALANSTVYGLGGICYGEQAHAQAVADQVRTGFIWINSFTIRDLAAPFGGRGQSGVGREGGE
ncbi:hypothetical protein E4T56_gene9458, partial [Termitomyces sp. T112]